MAIRRRAIDTRDKEERHHAILDAAERVLLRLTRRSPSMAGVDGALLLCHSYALILGFWQTARGAATRCASRAAGAAIDDHAAALTRSSAQDLERALRALWKGTLNRDVSRAA